MADDADKYADDKGKPIPPGTEPQGNFVKEVGYHVLSDHKWDLMKVAGPFEAGEMEDGIRSHLNECLLQLQTTGECQMGDLKKGDMTLCGDPYTIKINAHELSIVREGGAHGRMDVDLPDEVSKLLPEPKKKTDKPSGP